MMESPKTPVMHKAAVPRDNLYKHNFMFKDSPVGKSSPGVPKAVQSADDLVSVTVRKEDPSQKAGISLVERQNATYITKVDENGLFHDTDIEEGDKVLSINGKRLKKGEGSKHILKTISKAKATVTLVVKKANMTPTRGSRGGKVKKRPNRIFKKDLHRNLDTSLDPNHDPRILRQFRDDDKDQIPIKAKKIYRSQPVGVTIVEHNKMILVSDISLESPFRDSNLQLGDRVVGVNGMNFLNYPDAKLATTMAEKSPKEIEFVVEKGHEDIPDYIQMKLEELALLQSPSQEEGERIELEVDDIITPVKNYNSSFSGPFRTPTQREKELDRDVLQTPELPFNNSFNVSSLSLYGTPRQDLESEDENNQSFDLADRVLARQASQGKGDPLIKAGHNSWSPSAAPAKSQSPSTKIRKGKRKTTKPAKKPSSSKPVPVKKSLKLGLDDSSDESSLDEDVEKSLSTLKKKTNLHNSWSHPDQVKFPGQKSKKGKRRNLSSHSNSGKIERKTPKYVPKAKPKPIVVDDSGSSSSDDDLEAAAAEMLSPERKARYTNNLSFSKSISQMTPEEYEGDIIRIKVKKISESNPGVKVKKIAGIFILSDLPATEKRINVGSQVLAINGVMNINTVTKADSLIKQTKGFVSLMVDFSSPIDKRRVCPCCGDQIYGNGTHVDHNDLQNPDDSGLFTPKMNNHSGHGPSKTTMSSKYNLDDYMSETENSDDEDGDGRPFQRTHSSKFQPGDKFMIRVNTHGNPGISLFDYRGNIFVSSIQKGGSFYSTPIDTGDKLISMNGKKSEMIKTASNATSMLEDKKTVSLYVCRSDKSSAEYKEAIKRRR